jgi:hypothetical protein
VEEICDELWIILMNDPNDRLNNSKPLFCSLVY